MVTVAHIGLLLVSFVLTLLKASPRALFMVAALVLVGAGLLVSVLPEAGPDLARPGLRLTQAPFLSDFQGWEMIRLGIIATVLALILEGFHHLALPERRQGYLISYWLLAGSLCLPTLVESVIGLPRRSAAAETGLGLLQVVWRGAEIAGLAGIAVFALLSLVAVLDLIRRKDT